MSDGFPSQRASNAENVSLFRLTTPRTASVNDDIDRYLHLVWKTPTIGIPYYGVSFVSSKYNACPIVVIDQFHKSHNAPVTYLTIHHSEQKRPHPVLNYVLWYMGQVHSGICEIGLLPCCHTECILGRIYIWIFVLPREQSSWGQHGAHLDPLGPRWAPFWTHEPCYQGFFFSIVTSHFQIHLGNSHGDFQPDLPSGLNRYVPTIADKLRDLGYATHAVGKWDLGMVTPGYLPTNRGFDTFYGECSIVI